MEASTGGLSGEFEALELLKINVTRIYNKFLFYEKAGN